MANTLYTVQDMKKAMKVGKRSCSFQFIEGQPPKNHMNAGADFALSYISSLIANIMVQGKMEETPEKVLDNVREATLNYYKTYKKES